MRLAYIVLAHKNPDQVARLIKRLEGNNTHFFIHIDLLSPIDEFKRKIKGSCQSKSLHFIKNRVNVMWGGFSMVKATMALLEEAIQVNPNSVMLISGQDYPIKSNSYIRSFLQSNMDNILLDYKVVNLNEPHRLSNYHFADYTDYKKGKFHKNNIPLFYRLINKLLPKRKLLKGIIPYSGRQWFVFPIDVVQFLIKQYESNKKINSYYKFILCPDEQYFHTILLNSKFANRVVKFRTHWADYDAPHPIILKSKNFQTLEKSETLFARKFDVNIDEEILDVIDSRLLEIN